MGHLDSKPWLFDLVCLDVAKILCTCMMRELYTFDGDGTTSKKVLLRYDYL